MSGGTTCDVEHARSAATIGWRNLAKRLRLWLLTSLVPAILGCDPSVHIHGRATSSDGQPLKGVEARVECPHTCVYAVANDQGVFSGAQIGGCPNDCKLRVRSSGHRDFVAPLEKYCTNWRSTTCAEIEANVTLEAAP